MGRVTFVDEASSFVVGIERLVVTSTGAKARSARTRVAVRDKEKGT